MTTLSAPFEQSADVVVACAHCGLDVPYDLLVDEGPQFCCAGCRSVHAILNEHGLEQYYNLRRASDASAQPVTASTRRFDDFDAPSFHERYVRTEGSLQSVDLTLEGVHCAACLWLIEKLPQLAPGVAEARLDFGRRILHLTWNAEAISLSAIARRLSGIGYTPHPMTTSVHRREDRRYMVRIAIAGALAGNVMLIAFALYGADFHGMAAEYFHLFRWTSLGLTLAAVLGPGRVFFRSALAAVRARTTHMDVPIAVGLAAGTIGSAIATVRGTGGVYFESVTALVFLLLVGRWLLVRQQRRSAEAVERLFAMTPQHARQRDGADSIDVPIDALEPGDIVIVHAGETIPVDGRVTAGCSSVDRSWLTGESRAVAIDVGDDVHAGTVNVGGAIDIRVESAGVETRAGQLGRIVEACANRRAPVVRLADRIAGTFVVVVLALAVLTAALWTWIDPAHAVEHTIALLIITCPCALGLATPLAIVAALGRAARERIMIKGGAVMEALHARGGIVYLDKTGTVTEGRLAVRDWTGDDSTRSRVGALESESRHPVALALATEDEHTVADVDAARDGIAGTVDGQRLHAGTASFLARADITVPERFEQAAAAHIAAGWSPVFIAADEVVVAVAAVGDAIKPSARSTITALRKRGWRVELLSGDHPDVARHVGAALGLAPDAVHGDVSPEGKLAIVERAAAQRPVVMVGDGVNDAAALTAATVGVAVRGGAEASLAAADVYLDGGDLDQLQSLFNGASRTFGAIRRGLAVSLAYNVVGTTLAIAGLVNPLVAAVLMPLSSLTVITLALRARTFGVDRPCP